MPDAAIFHVWLIARFLKSTDFYFLIFLVILDAWNLSLRSKNGAAAGPGFCPILRWVCKTMADTWTNLLIQEERRTLGCWCVGRPASQHKPPRPYFGKSENPVFSTRIIHNAPSVQTTRCTISCSNPLIVAPLSHWIGKLFCALAKDLWPWWERKENRKLLLPELLIKITAYVHHVAGDPEKPLGGKVSASSMEEERESKSLERILHLQSINFDQPLRRYLMALSAADPLVSALPKSFTAQRPIK